MLRAEQAVLRAEIESTSADKTVVQLENGMLRSQLQNAQASTSPVVPFFEQTIKDTQDGEPILVVRPLPRTSLGLPEFMTCRDETSDIPPALRLVSKRFQHANCQAVPHACF